MLNQIKTVLEKRKGQLLLLSLLIAAEIYVFWPSVDGFFFGDSLRVLCGGPRTLRTLLYYFINIGHVGVYRPISQSLLSYLLLPLFKTHFAAYHIFSLALHVLNSIVVFLFLKRFYTKNVLAFVGAFFFGLHPTNFYATYDIAFAPDALYLLFYVLALIALMKYVRVEQKKWYILALILFVLSLWSKESAITFPALAFLYFLFFEKKFRSALKLVLPFAIVLLLYFAFYATKLRLVGGRIVPRIDPGYSFYFGHNIYENTRQLLHWTFFPPGWRTAVSDVASGLRVNYAIALAALGSLIYGLIRREAVILFSGVWFFLALAPVVIRERITLPHYLYLSLIPLSLILARPLSVLEKRSNSKKILFLFYLLIALLCYHMASFTRKSVLYDMEESWAGHSSQAAKHGAEFLEANQFKFYNAKSIYILSDPSGEAWYHFLGGTLFRFLTGREDLNVRVIADPGQLPDNIPKGGYVLKYANMRLYDITSEYRRLDEKELAWQDRNRTYDLIEAFIKGRSELITSETDFSDTGGRPVFLMDVDRQEKRNALITLPGRKVRFPIVIASDSCLEFGIALMYDTVDGAEAQALFEKDGKSEVLFSEHLHPLKRAADRRWHDYTIDLSRFKGERGYLAFECLPGPMGDATGDWLGWSTMLIRSK